MSDVTYNYSYTPTVDHRESNLYVEEYYSSTDTKIYFDDEEQTEIGFIQYEIQEQLKPVYGYNSRTWDDVVIGNRIVTGQFTVPIKNKGQQVFSVEDLSTYTGGDDNISSTTVDGYNLSEAQGLYDTDWFGTTVKNIDANSNTNIDSEYLTKLIALGYDTNANASTQEYQRIIKQFQQDNNLSVTGILNTNTKNYINNLFSQKKATSINLNGATGYNNITLNSGATKLSGDGLILNTIKTTNGNIYQVLDTNGNTYYMKGVII